MTEFIDALARAMHNVRMAPGWTSWDQLNEASRGRVRQEAREAIRTVGYAMIDKVLAHD